MGKLNNHHTMGIPEIWVVDPETRTFPRFEDGQLIRRTDFVFPSKSIAFPVSQIEAMVDQNIFIVEAEQICIDESRRDN